MEDGTFSLLYDVENRTLGAITDAGNKYLRITCRRCTKITVIVINYSRGWRPEWHLEALARRFRCERGGCAARWPVIRSQWNFDSGTNMTIPHDWGGGV